MEKSQYDELKAVQKKHWWFCGKSEIVMDLYNNYCMQSEDASVLDVGCGMGLMLEELSKVSEVYGMDIEPEAVEYCKGSFDKDYADDHICCGSLPDNVPYTRSFDTIVALDVLEHIENDRAALCTIYNLLVSKGILLLTVPALMCMWSGNDELNHHYRRYEKKDLEEKIRDAGFNILKSSYYNSYLFIPAYIIRKIKNMLHIVSSDVAITHKDTLTNRLLKYVFSSERKYLRKHNFPIGVSLIVVAKKE